MTSLQSHRTVSHSNTGYTLDNTNLDALLDDLQAGVGPRRDVTAHSSLVNGSSIHLPPGATGYREVTTTVTQERNGVPTTSRDYQIEYINPANSVTVLSERGPSPNPNLTDTFNRFESSNSSTSGKQVASYKTASYDYKFNEKTTDAHGNLIRPETNYNVNKAERSRETNKGALGANINELDVLLQELNTPSPPKRSEHSTSARTVETRVEREYPRSSTPRSSSLTRDNQHHQYGEIQQHSTPRAPHRDITPYGDTPATPRAPHRDVTPYGDTPTTPRAPHRNINVHREVNTIEQRSHISSGSRDRSGELSPTLRRRTPSPGGEFRPATFGSYPHSPAETRRSRSQNRYEDNSTHVTSKQVSSSESKYRTNYQNHASTARTEDTLPYRSPSPVSFPQHRSPSPVRRIVTRTDSGRALTRSDSDRAYRQPSPQPQLSDPNSPTVITYKYSSHSEQRSKYPGGYDDGPRDGPRPFPTPTPVPHPGDQAPPKKLDDLMASFNDTQQRSYTSNERYYREQESQNRQQDYHQQRPHDLQRSPSFERNIRPSSVKATQVYQTPTPAPTAISEVVPAPQTPSLHTRSSETQTAKSISGPPVYYPPGVELFAKKEEALMEQQSAGGKGKMKGKAKMQYKYEASQKSKEKSGTRVAVVPACLPLCCAMPCSIM